MSKTLYPLGGTTMIIKHPESASDDKAMKKLLEGWKE